jgi:hypothetical protein
MVKSIRPLTGANHGPSKYSNDSHRNCDDGYLGVAIYFVEVLTREKKMNIQELATIMNMPESSVRSFVRCLQVWTEKGFTIEQAIMKHQGIINRLVANPEAAVAMARAELED